MSKEKPEQFAAGSVQEGGQINPASPIVTEAALDKRMQDLKDAIDRFGKPIGYLIAGIIIVLFVGFVTILVSMQALVDESNNFKMSAYQQLLQEVQSLQKKP